MNGLVTRVLDNEAVFRHAADRVTESWAKAQQAYSCNRQIFSYLAPDVRPASSSARAIARRS